MIRIPTRSRAGRRAGTGGCPANAAATTGHGRNTVPSRRLRWRLSTALSTAVAVVVALTGVTSSPDPAAAQATPTTSTVRFLATSDLHFESLGNNLPVGTAFGPYSDLGASSDKSSGDCTVDDDNQHCDNVTNVAVLKAMLDTMRDSDGAVSGIISAGDQQRLTANDEWDAFRTIVDDYDAADRVYEGLGNHDVDCDYREHNGLPAGCWPQTQAKDIGSRSRVGQQTCYEQLHSLLGLGSAQDCPSYSWDVGGVHFVQLNLSPSGVYDDIRSGNDTPVSHRGMTFLQYDLGQHAADGRPVVLVHHYPVESLTHKERLEYWNAIAPYNVALIVKGHNHPDHSATGNSTVAPEVDRFLRPVKAQPGEEGYTADGDPRGGYSIPWVTAGPGCHESCGSFAVLPDKDAFNSNGGWWIDVSMQMTGNQGSLTITQKRTVPNTWEPKYTSPQTGDTGLGADVAVQYNDVTDKTTTAYDSWTGGFAVRPPAGVAITSVSLQPASSTPRTAVTVELLGADGSPQAAGVSTWVPVRTSSPTGQFWYTSQGPPTTGAIVPAGSSSATLYYGDPKAGYAELGASVETKNLVGTAYSAPAPLRTEPGQVHKLAFLTPERTATASAGGATAGPITVQMQDLLGNPTTTMYSAGATVPVPSQQLTLGTTSGTGYFSAVAGDRLTAAECPGCYLIGGGHSEATFYYGDTVPADSVNVTVGAADRTAGQRATVTAGGPSVIAIGGTRTVPRSEPAAVSATNTVTLKDAVGNTATTASALTVSLASSSPTGVFASDAGTPSRTATIPAGSSSAVFSYGDSTVGSVTLTATADGVTDGSRTVAVVDGAAAALRITSPSLSAMTHPSTNAGPFTISLVNSSGNPTASSTDVTVDLTTTSARALFGTRANAIGGELVTSAVIPAGQASVSIYYGDRAAGQPTLTVTAPGLGTDSQTAQIRPGAVRSVRFLGAPATTPASGTTGLALSPKLVDCFDNVTTAPDGGTLVYVSSDASLSTSIQGSGSAGTNLPLLVPAGSSTTPLYLGSRSTGRKGVRALTPNDVDPQCDPDAPDRNYNGYLTVDVTPGPLAALVPGSVLSGTSGSAAGVGPATFRLVDEFGNSAPADTPLTLTLTPSSSTGIVATSQNGPSVSSLTVPTGQDSASFWYGDTKAEAPKVVVSAGDATAAVQNYSIRAATASDLRFTTPSPVGVSGDAAATGPNEVELVDAHGNPVSRTTATTVTLASSSGTGFFAATSGGSRTSSITIPAGGRGRFYYGDSTPGTFRMTASSTGLAAATRAVAISAPVAFTSAAEAAFGLGTAGSFTVRTSGLPRPEITLTGDLPEGVAWQDRADGTASLTGTPVAGSGGTYSLQLSASNGMSAASQSFTLTVNRIATTTSTPSTNAEPALLHQAVSFTTQVRAGSTPITSGQVAFFDGSTRLGSASLSDKGEAVFTSSTLVVGTHSVTARYLGGGDYDGSTSQGRSQRVTYQVGLLYDPTLPVQAGARVNFRLTLQDVDGANVSAAAPPPEIMGVSPAPDGAVPTGQTFTLVGSNCPKDGLACPRYTFSLKTADYSKGSYELLFRAGEADAVVHRVPFQLA